MLPPGCVLSLCEREVFYNTFQAEEPPCLGCFKRETCPARIDRGLRAAHLLMDEPFPPLRICARCKALLVEGRISGSFRLWKCKAPSPGEADGGREAVCGWELSELGSPAQF